jgi:hypothetical protein
VRNTSALEAFLRKRVANLKAEEILVAGPRCGRWPMVAIERRLYSSPRLVFKFICVGCGYQHSNTRILSTEPEAFVYDMLPSKDSKQRSALHAI